MKYLSLTALAFALLPLAACEEKTSIPDGFERVAGAANMHFVFVDPEKVKKDKVAVRAAGLAICKVMKTVDSCEVYFWDKRENVAQTMPIQDKSTLWAHYELKNERVKLTTYWK